MESILARDQTQASSIVEVTVNCTHVINDSYGTLGTRGNRTRVIAHLIQNNPGTYRVLFLHALNKLFVNKH
jgi:hypothetical protein